MDIIGNPNSFQAQLVALEGTDYAVPGLWNDRYQTLLNNDAYLKAAVDALNGAEAPFVRLYQEGSALSQSSDPTNPIYYPFTFNEIDDRFGLYDGPSGVLTVPRSGVYLMRLFVSQVRCRIKLNGNDFYWAEHGGYLQGNDTFTINMFWSPQPQWGFDGEAKTSYSPNGRNAGILHEEYLYLPVGGALTFDYFRSQLYIFAPMIRLELYSLGR